MKQTVVGVFDRLGAAREAADSLGVRGFREGSVHVCAADGDEAVLQPEGAFGSAGSEHEGGVMDGLRSLLAEVFGPGDWSQQHQQEYAEALRRGAVVVKVEVNDDAALEVARETLQSAGAIDIEERVAEWRIGGWSAGAAAGGSDEAVPVVGGTAASEPATEGAGRAAVAQPATGGGRVRVYRHAEPASVAGPEQGTAAAVHDGGLAGTAAGAGGGAQAASGGASQGRLDLGDAAPVQADAPAPRVDALELLAADHRSVRRLFQDYERLVESQAEGSERQPLAEKLCVQLTVHAALEEEIFYPAARAALMPTDLVDEASVEHASARELIERIRAMDAEEELFDATVRVLGEYIDHHLREEEGELFPAVRATSLDLAELGLEMSDRRAELMAQFAQETRA